MVARELTRRRPVRQSGAHGGIHLGEARLHRQIGGTSRAGLSALLLGLDLAAAGRRTLVAAVGRRDRRAGRRAREQRRRRRGELRLRTRRRGDRGASRPRSATTEVLDVWRLPEDAFASQWEERFGAEVLAPVLSDAVIRALKDAGIAAVRARHRDPRRDAAARHREPAARAQLKPEQLADPLAASVGRAGAAHAGPAARARARQREAGRPHPRRVARRRRRRRGLRGHRADRRGPARRTASTLDRVEARRPRLQHLSQVARHPAVRAAAPPRSGAPRRAADAAQRALEVRLRRHALHRVRRGPAAAAARLQRVRRGRPDGGGAVREPRRARSPPTRSTTWPTRCSRRWWPPCSTSRAAAGSRAS